MMHCHNPSLLERQRAHLHWLQQQQQQQQQISTENLLCEGWPNDLTTPSPTTTTTTTITTTSSAQAGMEKCSKKRKADKSPMVGSEDDEKRMKGDQWEKQQGINGREDSGNNSSKENIEKKKHDFIHVRARRGQATDSHSLAERVRRERISERMKYLQGLVPGCDKITGKAGMLDEIINYVQSLQRQIEFLSMKLAAVNPRLDLNMESLLYTKEMNLPCNNSNISTAGTSPPPPEVVDPTFLQFHSLQQAVASCGLDMDTAMNPVELAVWRSISAPVSTPAATTEPFLDSFVNVQRTSAGWDNDLHNLYGSAFPFHSLQGNILSNMKTEM